MGALGVQDVGLSGFSVLRARSYDWGGLGFRVLDFGV